MPEREARSLHVNNGKSVQPVNPHQSAWLTHWTGTRFESTTHDHLTQLGRSEVDDQDIKKHLPGIEIASDNFGSSKGIRDVDLAMSLKKPGSQSFPFFKRGQESGRSSISNEGGETRGGQALESQVSLKKLTTTLNAETSSRECHFQPESVSQIPIEQVKYHMFFGDGSYSGSRLSKEKFANSHTTHGPENFRQLTSAFASKEHLPETNFLEQQHPSYCSHSAALVGERNLNNFPKHEKSEMPPFLRQNKAAVMKNDPSTSRSPAFIEEQYKRMQKHIGMGFFPHQTGTSETTKSGRPCSFQDVPQFIHDVEMARMSAPLSSVQGLAGGLHSFSRTTHSLLITKQTDGKLYQENQIFRESTVSSQLKGDGLRELNCIPPLVTHGQRGVKLQLLDSSDHESQENVEDVKAVGEVQKNESSADTDAMDMESFKENCVSGVHLISPNKNVMMESNLPLQSPVNLSTEKDTGKKLMIELPDINLDLSALPAASISTEKPEPCSSRTQSLDMNTLQFNVDHSSNSKSDECSDSNLGSEPGSRWIKRLKLSASSSLALGTKTSKLAETSSNGKQNEFFTRVVEHNPKPVLDIRNGKDSESLSGKFQLKESVFQTGECSTKEQHPSMVSLETKRENKDITLSHSWIQRWSHTQNQKNQKTVEICKPEENSKPAPEEFEKRQFPSIAAMALMGKAMTGFQQCKFQKKESCVVWNTKSFEQ
ncbi:uncharacterized protein LOC112500061 isoform X2 [Cynara cardunculus var. scolymus]|uniref:uncharacterized protein LOC112500061 isoform X2 n=1 Tax=Cynara cardunculus var. scolymus TaxID=59895 RepID=UPI000D62B0DD|nr:uncharacterized protein LOC112500061 isoform X2 [Cynara cardunculus var. scolymus]